MINMTTTIVEIVAPKRIMAWTMPENTENKDKPPAADGQQHMAQAKDAKGAATGTTTTSDELSEDDLAAVAGGGRSRGTGPNPDPRLVIKPPVFPV